MQVEANRHLIGVEITLLDLPTCTRDRRPKRLATGLSPLSKMTDTRLTAKKCIQQKARARRDTIPRTVLQSLRTRRLQAGRGLMDRRTLLDPLSSRPSPSKDRQTMEHRSLALTITCQALAQHLRKTWRRKI